MSITLSVCIEDSLLAYQLRHSPETLMDILAEIAEDDPDWDLTDAHSGSSFHRGVAQLLETIAKKLRALEDAF